MTKASLAARGRRRGRRLVNFAGDAPSGRARRRPFFQIGGFSGNRLDGVKDSAAGFALNDFVIVRPADFLKRVRKQPHAAAAALFGGSFGERDAVVAFSDASVNRKDLFGNLRGDVFALREAG